jgi:hypothetical protein
MQEFAWFVLRFGCFIHPVNQEFQRVEGGRSIRSGNDVINVSNAQEKICQNDFG